MEGTRLDGSRSQEHMTYSQTMTMAFFQRTPFEDPVPSVSEASLDPMEGILPLGPRA